MNKHSKAFEKKKAELEKIEVELRKAIDHESDDLESTAIKVLKIAATVSTVVLVSYGIYRWINGSNQKEEAKSKEHEAPSIMSKLVDKVTDVVASLAVQNISKYIDNLKSDLEKEIKR